MLVKKSNQLTSARKTHRKSDEPVLRMIKVDFDKDTMRIHLHGGRILSIPVNKFPEIKKLSASQRKSYHISGGISLDFDNSDEVYHINELLGIELN
ncbi:MAG TPA: DUF2442 domain-containing protein [Ignavibacteria bacterium]|nr:DUF2442 domain-containing protein [Ignavibacteria bacterium]